MNAEQKLLEEAYKLIGDVSVTKPNSVPHYYSRMEDFKRKYREYKHFRDEPIDLNFGKVTKSTHTIDKNGYRNEKEYDISCEVTGRNINKKRFSFQCGIPIEHIGNRYFKGIILADDLNEAYRIASYSIARITPLSTATVSQLILVCNHSMKERVSLISEDCKMKGCYKKVVKFVDMYYNDHKRDEKRND